MSVDDIAASGRPWMLRAVLRRLRGATAQAPSRVEEDVAFIKACGLFDSVGYLRRYPDVARAMVDPIEHYVVHGAAEGRTPCESFDTRYYLESNPDVAASGINPLRHFCEFGWKEGRAPSAGFDMATYAAAQIEAGTNPMRSLAIGERKDGSTASAPGLAASSTRDDYQIIVESGIFDRTFYLESYPSVAEAGVDPIRHYITHGALERRNPSPYFNTGYYLDKNPDVLKAGANPLVHFCEYGWKEFRQPSPGFDIVRYWLTYMAREAVPGNPLLHYLAQGHAQGLSIHTLADQTPVECNRMAANAQSLIADADLEILKKLGKAMTRIARWGIAEEAFRRVAESEWNDPNNHVALAHVLAAQGKWWLVVESMKTAVELQDTHPAWFFTLASAQERMNRFQAAADAFRQALALSPGRADWHYRLGYVLERAGASEDATENYAEALRLSADEEVRRYGVGVFHQVRGLWALARDAYSAEMTHKPADGGLHYRLGMAYDRLYEWKEAARCYTMAISLAADTRMPSWHFRLGFVNERMGRWQDASDAYSAAILLSNRHVAYWNYRLAYVLEKAGQHEEACAAYRNTRPESTAMLYRHPSDSYFAQFSSVNPIRIPWEHKATAAIAYYRLGERCEWVGDLGGAERAYSNALARSSNHMPRWHYRLGHVLAAAGRHREACEAFRQTRVLQRAHGVSEDNFRKNLDQFVTTSYVEYRECLPVRDDVILYESFNGNSLSCSPLALFRTLLEHPAYRDHLHVWVLNDPDRIPGDLKHRQNVVFVSKGSDGYLRYVATAKYLINNSGFPPYFIRRPGQKYLATWHGTPLKTLGKEQKYKFYDHKRTQRNYLQASHIITPNPHTTGITLDSYDIRPLYTGLFAETGYPRIDLTLNASEERKQWLHERLGIAEGRPVVLYAPTWRGTLEDVQFDSARLEHDLVALSQQGCQVLFRGHSLLERVLKDDHFVDCQVVPADIDTNELLSVVDVLVTDYSSVFFDFMATGRPILYYIYDVEEYEQERGLYFGMDEMPGFKCRTIEELCDALGQAIRTGMPDAEHYADAKHRYNCHDDGYATERVIDFFFNDNLGLALEYRTSNRPAVIMAGGSFAPNGITTSFINLVNNIDRSLVDVVVALSPTTVETSRDNIAQFYKLPADVLAVPRYGNMPLSLEERSLRKHHESGVPLNDEALAIVKHAYQREFIRIFGPKQFEAAVSFAGYDAFWTAILVANDFRFRKVVYLHNDMYSEYVARFPDLERMFQLYRMADRLISVSEQTHELNMSNLASRYGIDRDKFDFCDNLSNPEEIILRSQEDLERIEDNALFEGEGPVFINLARLSVEKDHEKLIRAFAMFAHDRHSAQLLILGAGPLEHHLQKVVGELDLGDQVHLLGYRTNPYPYLRRADCFILSSNHEGQPMTLLEALVLSKPIVATDIVGNRSVLHGRPGLLVPNSIAGLVTGMSAFAEGKVSAGFFDWRSYQLGAVDMFNRRVLGQTATALS